MRLLSVQKQSLPARAIGCNLARRLVSSIDEEGNSAGLKLRAAWLELSAKDEEARRAASDGDSDKETDELPESNYSGNPDADSTSASLERIHQAQVNDRLRHDEMFQRQEELFQRQEAKLAMIVLVGAAAFGILLIGILSIFCSLRSLKAKGAEPLALI